MAVYQEEEDKILLKKKKKKEKKESVSIDIDDYDDIANVDEVEIIAVQSFPSWIPEEILKDLAKKMDLKIVKIKGSFLYAISDNKVIRFLDYSASKNFRIKYACFLQKLHETIQDSDLLFEEMLNKRTIYEFARKLIVEINEEFDFRRVKKDEMKRELLSIMKDIIFEEEADLLVEALVSVRESLVEENMKEFLRLFLKKVQFQLFGIIIRSFQTLYFFNFKSENLAKKYMTYESVEIKTKDKMLVLRNIKIPTGGGFYRITEKIAVDRNKNYYYGINLDYKKFADVIIVFTFFLIDNIFIEQACWFLDMMEKIYRRFNKFQTIKLRMMLIELRDADIKEIKRFKEMFKKMNSFLIGPLSNINNKAEDMRLEVIKSALRNKGVFKNYWLGSPPSWFMEMLPHKNLDRLRLLSNMTEKQLEALISFTDEMCKALDELIEEKELKRTSKRWKNVNELARTLATFLRTLFMGDLK